MSLFLIRVAIFAGILATQIASSEAQTCLEGEPPPKVKCGGVHLMIPYAVRGFISPIDAYSLKQSNGKTYRALYTGRSVSGCQHKDGTPVIPWRLLERRGESLDYCLVAFGDRVNLLKSAPEATPQKRYGMPGSGYQQCSDGTDFFDSVIVRLWANKELGDSTIIHLTSKVGDNDFTFLIANDTGWILLNTSKSKPSKSCYYSRGQSVSIIENFKVRQDLIDGLASLERLCALGKFGEVARLGESCD